MSSGARRLRIRAGAWRRYAERHQLVDRSHGSQSLVTVLAGHKPQLWPHTLPRIARAVPAGADVCLTTAGIVQPELRAFAEQHGWSYLSTQRGHVCVAQNLTLRAHPDARLVYKVDEDMFVSDGFFAALGAGYARVRQEAEYAVGFCSPTVNVNGFSYLDFVRHLGLEAEWRERFGAPRRGHYGVTAQRDGQAAVWLWSHGLPVDATAAAFARRPFGYSVVPHRFSIGAIVYERDLWTQMGGFSCREPSPGLGEDEHHLAVECSLQSRIIAVLDNLYAGHFSFGPQTGDMMAAYRDRLADF